MIPNIHKKLARLAAVQAIFQMEMTSQSAAAVTKQFVESGFQMILDDVVVKDFSITLFHELLEGTAGKWEELTDLIAKNLAQDWSIDRIESVARAILRVGLYELIYHLETRAVVIVSEYADMAHAFFSTKEASFVNGLLNKLARQLRPGEF